MKTNILTKLLALVLAIVMVLGTCAAAIAEESVVEFSNSAYSKVLLKVAEALYEKFMNCTTYEEGLLLGAFFTGTQGQAFLNLLGPEREAAFRALEEELYQSYEEIVFPEVVIAVPEEPVPSIYESDAPIVNYTNVAPLKAPVTGGQ